VSEQLVILRVCFTTIQQSTYYHILIVTSFFHLPPILSSSFFAKFKLSEADNYTGSFSLDVLHMKFMHKLPELSFIMSNLQLIHRLRHDRLEVTDYVNKPLLSIEDTTVDSPYLQLSENHRNKMQSRLDGYNDELSGIVEIMAKIDEDIKAKEREKIGDA
jgi:hypothetical protein